MVDFRRSIDGLSALVMTEMKGNPKESIYLFINRGRDKIKCLFWHKNGFVLFYKRLEKGKFS
jgi:transposase